MSGSGVTIDPQSKVTIGLLCTIVTFLVGAIGFAWNLTLSIERVTTDLSYLVTSVSEIRSSLTENSTEVLSLRETRIEFQGELRLLDARVKKLEDAVRSK